MLLIQVFLIFMERPVQQPGRHRTGDGATTNFAEGALLAPDRYRLSGDMGRKV